MFGRRSFLTAFLTLILAGALALGCDPKLTGTEDAAGGGGDDGGGGDVVLVTPEAEAVGAIIATHLKIMTASLAKAAEFDDSASAAPVLRDFFTNDCMTLTTLDAVDPVFEISFGDPDPTDNCVDERGTVYRGGGTVRRGLEGLDGFIFDPYGLMESALIATNDEKDHLNHVYSQGSLSFTFVRAGTGEATAIEVGNWLKHGMLGSETSFTYLNMRFNGSPGSSVAYPSSGATAQISWTGIENTVVEFSGSSIATFTLVNITYNIHLATGAVTIQAT